MKNAYWGRAYTVYDAKLETGNLIPGGYIIAAVYASEDEADAALVKYRADNRYDVRPSGAQAIAEAAMEIAELSKIDG